MFRVHPYAFGVTHGVPPETTVARRVLGALRAAVVAAMVGGLVPTGAEAAGAQQRDGVLVGRVLGVDEAPLPDTLVRLFGPNRLQLGQTRTDGDGRFRFAGLVDGNYELRVTSPPFRDRVQVVTVGRGAAEAVVSFAAIVDESVTVSGKRGLIQDDAKVAGTVRSLSVGKLEERAPDLLPRMLGEETGVIAQQTTPGQGSPILRGQSAQAVLYLIDGIRYNNATYRAGNTQYLAWIPGVAVDGLDIQLGPSGVNYGSDALGGAINVSSASTPALARAGAWKWNGGLRVFGESASAGVGGDATVGVASRRFAAFGGATGSKHRDVRGGRGEDSHNVLIRYLGLSRPQVQDTLGTRMVDTDYGSAGFTGKATGRVRSDTGTLTGFYLHNEQFDIRRYDRLLGGDGRHIAAFTPQLLDFGYVRYQDVISDDVFFETTFSVNRQTDGRRDQRFPDSTLKTEQNTVSAFGYETLASMAAGDHLLSFGGEIYDEYVDASRSEIIDGSISRVRPRVPDGSRYTSFGGFVLDDWTAIRDRLQISGGLRYSYFRAAVDAADNLIDGVPAVPSTREAFSDLTFNVGTTIQVSDSVNLYGRVARGFRAPSLFDFGEQGLTGGGFEITPREAVDLGAFVGDSAGDRAVDTGIAWSGLSAELLWSFETGFRWRGEDARFDFAFFDSELTDTISRRTMIVREDVVGRTVGGEVIVAQDDAGRVFVAAEEDPVVSRANIGRTRVWGIEWLFETALRPNVLLVSKGGAQRGRELDTGFWARKIAPDRFDTVLRWNQPGGRLWLEGVLIGTLAQNRWNPADFDDPRVGAFRDAESIADYFNNGAVELGVVQDGVLLATGETLDQVTERILGSGLQGNPLFSETAGWWTLTMRGGYTFGPQHEINFSLANLLDRNYRLHGSGFDSPGISATVAWIGSF